LSHQTSILLKAVNSSGSRRDSESTQNEGYDEAIRCILLTCMREIGEPCQLTNTVSAIIQRVLSASVTVDKEVVSSIGRGVLVFAAVAPGDTEKEMNAIAAKVVKMKLWEDDAGGKVGTSYGSGWGCACW